MISRYQASLGQQKGRSPSPPHVLWLLLCITFGMSSPAAAQTVLVRVLHAETGQPLVGALVAVESEAALAVGRTLTDEQGRALFFHFGLGMHRARAEMIGMATAQTDLFDALPSGRLELELRLAPRPIELPGLGVETGERCRSPREEGLLTARIWDEARKALTAASLADEQGLYRYQTMLYEQDLDRDSRVVARSRESRREANMRTPFHSRPASELMERGFVERSGMVDIYLAPDADVLLSDLFLDEHCFRVRLGESGETQGFVGLAFEPAPGRRDLPDIAGTMWLDSESAELQWLEYRYVNIDPELRLDEVGGRVEFRRMPDGGWIVPKWWIRMPRVSLQQELRGYARRTYVAGFTEAGGVVLDVQGPGRILGHDVTGAVEGVVQDSLGSPQPGVSVELLGTERAVVTDSAGAFRFSSVIEGVYEVRVADPVLEQLGLPATEVTRAVINGEVTVVEVAMPSARSVLAESCVSTPRRPEWQQLAREYPATGIVFGWIHDEGSNEPLAGATVRVLTPTVDFVPGAPARSAAAPSVTLGGVDLGRNEAVIVQGSVGLQTQTDERGFYRFCKLPEGHRLLMSVQADEVEVVLDEFRIEDAAGQVERSVLIGRSPR